MKIKKRDNKRGITKIKSWFLIINLVLAVVAFGFK